MIDWTYVHFRVFMRYLAPQALLYTEMQTTGAIAHNPGRALHFHHIEHPVAIQLGGSDPKALAECAQTAEQLGYDEVNLNLGCPSDRVQAGRFGACLMNESELVAQCIKAMKKVVSIPVTAKTRIGIDHQDSFEYFSSFAHRLVDAGSDKLIVHARKAWLNGLNPKQNRTIPPINYEFVYKLKEQIPHIPIVINGNILNEEEIHQHLKHVDGVMLGRLACDNPYRIAEMNKALYPGSTLLSRHQLWLLYKEYLLNEHLKGASLSLLVKPMFGLVHGLPGASQWKKKLMLIVQTKNIALFDELDQYLLDLEIRGTNSDPLLLEAR